MIYRNFLILGGSGFLGTHLTQALVQMGARVRVPTRRRNRARHLYPLPTVEIIEADIHNPNHLAPLMVGQDVVINLVGILHGRRGDVTSSFNQIHAELPRKIAAACVRSHIRRLLHVSALGASSNAPSDYLRSKILGENFINGRAGVTTTIFRPSVIFGPGDNFLTLFSRLTRRLPILPLAGGDVKMQPVFVGDVVKSMLTSLEDVPHQNQIYELGGPQIMTLKEIVCTVARLAKNRTWVFSAPMALGVLQAWFLEFLPGRLMSRDNLKSLRQDNICAKVPSLPFGLTATALEQIAPSYIGTNCMASELEVLRTYAGR